MTTRKPLTLASTLVHALLWLSFAAVVYPMLWLFGTSLKADREIFLRPLAPPNPSDLRWDNFARAWVQGHFGNYSLNSVLITVVTVAATVLLASMAAYALARFRFRGDRAVQFYFLAGLMLPLQLAVVPLFFQMKAMNLLGTRIGLLLVYIAFGLPFGVFVLTGFFRSIPASLHEAALIDGAGEFRAFWSIMLPLARPGVITVAIFTFLGTWTEFFLAFMLLSGGGGAEEAKTLPMGLADVTINGQFKSDWGISFAGLVLMVLPMLAVYVVLQKYLTRGMTSGALKG